MQSADVDWLTVIESLPPERQNLLRHFKEISGDVEVAECARILTRYNWDLSAAVNYFMSESSYDSQPTQNASENEHNDIIPNGESYPDSAPLPNTSASSSLPLHSQLLQSDSDTMVDTEHLPHTRLRNNVTSVRNNVSYGNSWLTGLLHHSTAPDNQIGSPNLIPEVRLDSPSIEIIQHTHRMSYWDWTKHIVFAPVYFVYSTLCEVVELLWSLFRTPRQLQLADPVHDVNQFIESFKAKYCPTISHQDEITDTSDMYVPPFYRNSYSEALRRAKTELKFLLVYLHGDSHEDTDAFCREILTHPNFVTFLRNCEVVLWGCNIQSAEGYHVSQALREHTYPFLGIIVLKALPEIGYYSGRGNVSNRMTLVGRIQGYDPLAAASMGHPVFVNQLKRQIEKIMRNNESSLVAARFDRQERDVALRLRAEQDREYQESIRLDQERQQAKEMAEAAEKMRVDKEKLQLYLMEKAKAHVRETMPENILVTSPTKSSSEDRVRVLIRMPDGNKFERSYQRDSSSKLLFLSVFGYEGSPSNFGIYTNFPKKLIPCSVSALLPPLQEDLDLSVNFWESCTNAQDDEPQSFSDLGFSKSEMVLVINQDA